MYSSEQQSASTGSMFVNSHHVPSFSNIIVSDAITSLIIVWDNFHWRGNLTFSYSLISPFSHVSGHI